MFHFFRKIRRELHAEGKLVRYFWYALGEVLLVMVGILLALQASDWVESKQNANSEARYIANLMRDLELQLEEIDNQLIASQQMYDSLSIVVKTFSKPGPIRVDKELIMRMSAMVDRRTFTVKDPTLSALLSSGDLALMQNESFKDEMIKYYQKLERMELIILKNNDTKDLTLMPKAFELIETIGPEGFKREKFTGYQRIPDTFVDFDESQLQVDTINTILESPQNKLTLINIIRYRHALLFSDINMMESAKKATNDLIMLLNGYNETL